MNKKVISFKVDNYTIYLHRAPESSKEIKQDRMDLLVSNLCYIALKPMIKYFEEYYPELKFDINNILLKNMYKSRKYNKEL